MGFWDLIMFSDYKEVSFCELREGVGVGELVFLMVFKWCFFVSRSLMGFCWRMEWC